MKDQINELIKGLDLAIKLNKSVLWVGIIENQKSRKYKYEVYWFSTEHSYDNEDSNQFQNCESRMCTDLKQAYSYGFDAIRDVLSENPYTSISITDLVHKNEE